MTFHASRITFHESLIILPFFAWPFCRSYCKLRVG